MKSKYSKLIIILSFFFSSALSQRTKHSSSVVWDDIKRISYDSATSIVPQIVATGDTVHLLWFGIFDKAQPDSGGGVEYSRSTDGGITFSPQKKLILDDSSGAKRHLLVSGRYVYLIHEALTHPNPSPYWEAAIIRSTDAGLTWSNRKVIGDYTPYAAIAKDSSIYVYAGFVENNLFKNAMLISHDYGVTWDTMRVLLKQGPNVAQIAITSNALHLIRTIGISGYQEVFYNRSTDFGFTWSAFDTISTNDGLNGQNPRFVSQDNNLYVVWNDQKYGGNFSGTIFLRRSTDEGITWQPEQIISQLNTSVFSDISTNNNLSAIVWDNDYTISTLNSLRLRISEDYGKTFGEVIEISSDSSHAGDPTIKTLKKNIFVAWWDQNNWEIYYRRGLFNPTSVKTEPNAPQNYSLMQNYPNPFNPITTIEYSLSKPSKVVISIYSILGNKLLTLVDGMKGSGRHKDIFNASSYSSGIYFYEMKVNDITKVNKMILIK